MLTGRMLLIVLPLLLAGCTSTVEKPDLCERYMGTEMEEECLKWRKRDLNIPEFIFPQVPLPRPTKVPTV